MKFRGTITDTTGVRQFAQLLTTLGKCSTRIHLRIQPEMFIFVMCEKDIRSNGAAAWCEVPKDTFFNEFKMEGVCPEDNEIFLEISTEMMNTKLGSLKSSNSVMSIKIKLTNKVMPCLTFEILSESVKSNTVCIHDIPVNLVPRSHWDDYQQPTCPPFDISVSLPDLRIVRSALERIKGCGPRIVVTATSDGTALFTVDSYVVNSAIKFQNLRVFETDNNDQQSGQPQQQPSTARPRSIGGKAKRSIPNQVDENGQVIPTETFKVEVDSKHFFQFIPLDEIRPDSFVISLLQNEFVHLFLIYGEVSLQYFIPGIL